MIAMVTIARYGSIIRRLRPAPNVLPRMPSPPSIDRPLHGSLDAYRRQWPDESDVVSLFDALLAEPEARGGPSAYARERLDGHFTASGWLVDAAGTRVLLTHHRKLGRWLQLGGHADGDTDLAGVALREAEEESGLSGLVVDAELFDLDRHWIPGRGDVPGHWHYDARYVVRATAGEAFVVGDESLDLAWRDIAAIQADPAADGSLRRMARKWLARHR